MRARQTALVLLVLACVEPDMPLTAPRDLDSLSPETQWIRDADGHEWADFDPDTVDQYPFHIDIDVPDEDGTVSSDVDGWSPSSENWIECPEMEWTIGADSLATDRNGTDADPDIHLWRIRSGA